MSDHDEICDQIDDLITSVDSMRWRPEPAEESRDQQAPDTWVPPDCKARFDELYATIDSFAGAINDRMRAWEARVHGSFTPAVERDALTTTQSDQR